MGLVGVLGCMCEAGGGHEGMMFAAVSQVFGECKRGGPSRNPIAQEQFDVLLLCGDVTYQFFLIVERTHSESQIERTTKRYTQKFPSAPLELFQKTHQIYR